MYLNAFGRDGYTAPVFPTPSSLLVSLSSSPGSRLHLFGGTNRHCWLCIIIEFNYCKMGNGIGSRRVGARGLGGVSLAAWMGFVCGWRSPASREESQSQLKDMHPAIHLSTYPLHSTIPHRVCGIEIFGNFHWRYERGVSNQTRTLTQRSSAKQTWAYSANCSRTIYPYRRIEGSGAAGAGMLPPFAVTSHSLWWKVNGRRHQEGCKSSRREFIGGLLCIIRNSMWSQFPAAARFPATQIAIHNWQVQLETGETVTALINFDTEII